MDQKKQDQVFAQYDRLVAGIAARWKAVAGFLAPGAVLLTGAILDSSPGGAGIVREEWVSMLVAMFVTGAAVHQTPNKDTNGEHQDMSVQEPGA